MRQLLQGVFVLGLSWVADPLSQAPGAKRGTIEIYVVSNHGMPLGDADVKLSDADGRIVAESAKPLLKDVPYGCYQLAVTKSGFYTATARVVVDRPYVWMPVGLTIGMEHPEYTSLTGTVLKTPTGAPIWLKLVSSYWDCSTSTRPDTEGKFEFRIPYRNYGHAVLLTFHGSKLYDMREVMVRHGEPDIIIK